MEPGTCFVSTPKPINVDVKCGIVRFAEVILGRFELLLEQVRLTHLTYDQSFLVCLKRSKCYVELAFLGTIKLKVHVLPRFSRHILEVYLGVMNVIRSGKIKGVVIVWLQLIEAGAVDGVAEVLRGAIALFAFLAGDAFCFAKAAAVVSIASHRLMIAVAGGAVVPEFGLPPKTVLTILAMFSFGVVSARPAVVRAEGARGVAVTLALGAGREVPPITRADISGVRIKHLSDSQPRIRSRVHPRNESSDGRWVNFDRSVIAAFCAHSQSGSRSIVTPATSGILQAAVARFDFGALLDRTSFFIISPSHALSKGKGDDISVGIHAALDVITPHAHTLGAIPTGCFGGAGGLATVVVTRRHGFLVLASEGLHLVGFFRNTFVGACGLPRAVELGLTGQTVVQVFTILGRRLPFFTATYFRLFGVGVVGRDVGEILRSTIMITIMITITIMINLVLPVVAETVQVGVFLPAGVLAPDAAERRHAGRTVHGRETSGWV